MTSDSSNAFADESWRRLSGNERTTARFNTAKHGFKKVDTAVNADELLEINEELSEQVNTLEEQVSKLEDLLEDNKGQLEQTQIHLEDKSRELEASLAEVARLTELLATREQNLELTSSTAPRTPRIMATSSAPDDPAPARSRTLTEQAAQYDQFVQLQDECSKFESENTKLQSELATEINEKADLQKKFDEVERLQKFVQSSLSSEKRLRSDAQEQVRQLQEEMQQMKNEQEAQKMKSSRSLTSESSERAKVPRLVTANLLTQMQSECDSEADEEIEEDAEAESKVQQQETDAQQDIRKQALRRQNTELAMREKELMDLLEKSTEDNRALRQKLDETGCAAMASRCVMQ